MSGTGRLLVISGPSGVGKGTVIKKLQSIDENFTLSVSVTSREPREGEIEGVHYFFKSKIEFMKMVEDGQLIEWDNYLDNYYGSSRLFVNELLSKGKDVVFDITFKGAFELKKNYSESILVFLVPPSFDELRERLRIRGTESNEIIEKRLSEAKREMNYIDRFDYFVINDNVMDSAEMVRSIILAEKCKVKSDSYLNAILGRR